MLSSVGEPPGQHRLEELKNISAIKDRMDAAEIILVSCPKKEQYADMITKGYTKPELEAMPKFIPFPKGFKL